VEERLNSRENASIGATPLPAPYSDRAYNTTGGGQDIMVSENGVLSPKIVNETRFRFFRNWSATPGNLLPQINLAGAFVRGGNGFGCSSSLIRRRWPGRLCWYGQ